jgi:hypothetical protein
MAQLEEEEYFFELPYWKTLLVQQNLDVMHIEKNIWGCGRINILVLYYKYQANQEMVRRLGLA